MHGMQKFSARLRDGAFRPLPYGERKKDAVALQKGQAASGGIFGKAAVFDVSNAFLPRRVRRRDLRPSLPQGLRGARLFPRRGSFQNPFEIDGIAAAAPPQKGAQDEKTKGTARPGAREELKKLLCLRGRQGKDAPFDRRRDDDGRDGERGGKRLEEKGRQSRISAHGDFRALSTAPIDGNPRRRVKFVGAFFSENTAP